MTYTTLDDVRGDLRIDSRNLIELADSLREELNYTSMNSSPPREELAEDIAVIEDLADEIGTEWPYGAFLIRTDDFEYYAEELAEDIGAISSDANWPLYCIDWERAASELAMDYITVTFLGHDYYVRP